jgi:hypothetical protein
LSSPIIRDRDNLSAILKDFHRIGSVVEADPCICVLDTDWDSAAVQDIVLSRTAEAQACFVAKVEAIGGRGDQYFMAALKLLDEKAPGRK